MATCVDSSTPIIGHPRNMLSNTDKAQSGGADSPLPPGISVWAKRLLGSMFFLALPFYKRAVGIEDEVETDVKVVVALVEKVAMVVEKVASDVADGAPANGKLKKAALEVEHVAETVVNDAEEAKVILHKVDEIKEEIEDYVMVEKADLLGYDGKAKSSPSA